MQFANLSDHFVTLQKGYVLGSIEEIDEVIEDPEQEESMPRVKKSSPDGSDSTSAFGSTSGTGSCSSTTDILENGRPWKKLTCTCRNSCQPRLRTSAANSLKISPLSLVTYLLIIRMSLQKMTQIWDASLELSTISTLVMQNQSSNLCVVYHSHL